MGRAGGGKVRERAFDACTHSGAIHTAGYDGILWYQARIG
jgi:hypothetical protein